MVALQILVLIVGVRILLGELKAESKRFSFFFTFEPGSNPDLNNSFGPIEYRFSSRPSQG